MQGIFGKKIRVIYIKWISKYTESTSKARLPQLVTCPDLLDYIHTQPLPFPHSQQISSNHCVLNRILRQPYTTHEPRSMSTAPEPTKQNSPSSSKGKTREKDKKPKQSGGGGGRSQGERLKTIVRRLPPNLPEDTFWKSVQRWVTDETVVWKSYCQGKVRKRYGFRVLHCELEDELC